jgi:hypothetical protein
MFSLSSCGFGFPAWFYYSFIPILRLDSLGMDPGGTWAGRWNRRVVRPSVISIDELLQPKFQIQYLSRTIPMKVDGMQFFSVIFVQQILVVGPLLHLTSPSKLRNGDSVLLVNITTPVGF